MTAPHDVRRSGNLITVMLSRDEASASAAAALAKSALGRGERLEATYESETIFGFVAKR